MATFQIKADNKTTKIRKRIATKTTTIALATTILKSYQQQATKPQQKQQALPLPLEPALLHNQLKPQRSQVGNVLLVNKYQQKQQRLQQLQQESSILCSHSTHDPHTVNHHLQLQQQQAPEQQHPYHQQHNSYHQPHKHSRSTVLQPQHHNHQHHQYQRQACPFAVLRSLRLGTKFKFSPTDSSLFMMITMLVVVTVVISGNAVFAAQRDSYKPKDSHSLSNNANAIPNAISGTGSAASNGNTNNVSNGNTNSNSASSSNSNTATSTDNDSNTSLTSSTGSAVTTTTTTTTTLGATSSTVSSSSSNSGGGSSHSLQKGGSVSTSGINRNTIEVTEDGRNGPYFDKAASKNITALLGKTAYLNCRVKNLGNKTMLLQVSWVRHRDIHLLTVGRYTYTSDQRFRAIHQPQTEDWILQIKYPQHRDSGIYECQVSTTPHMSHYIHLNVVEPSTEIIGAPDLYIESGSTINLTCVILNSPEPPAYIFWNHNNAIINYDSPRGGVSVVTNKGETTTSFLLIKSARPSDSGHYQCNPSNAKPKSVTVHVLNGEFPAAMQHAALGQQQMTLAAYLLVCLSLYCCSWAYARRSMPLHAVVN